MMTGDEGDENKGMPIPWGSFAPMFTHWAVQLLFGVLYHFLVVAKYPDVRKATVGSQEVQEMGAISAMCQARVSTCLLAICCAPALVARTVAKTKVDNYWKALCLMTCFP